MSGLFAKFWVIALFVVISSLDLSNCANADEVRLALVIGNSKYQHTTSLDNPASDARLVAQTLKKQRFEVQLQTDLDLKATKRAFQVFYGRAQAAGRDAVVLVYYAGHGVQVRGVNYLVPVDAEIEREIDVDVETVRADSIMEMIELAGSPLNIVVLDACRNNPFRGFRAVTRGLAEIKAPTGTLIAFSTSPGRVATDGPKNGNSPYSAAFARALGEPGLKIEDVFKRVRKIVSLETNGQQVPWESTSLVGDFYAAGRGKPETADDQTGVWEAALKAAAKREEEARRAAEKAQQEIQALKQSKLADKGSTAIGEAPDKHSPLCVTFNGREICE